MPQHAEDRHQHTSAERPRVLLVDDDETVLASLQRMLSSAGYEVTTAANAARAYEHLQRGDFAVVVSDIAMPDLDGVRLLRLVRQRDTDLPVVLVTGSPDLQTAVQALSLGALGYLIKPVFPGELKDVVRRGAEHHQLARAKTRALAQVRELRSVLVG